MHNFIEKAIGTRLNKEILKKLIPAILSNTSDIETILQEAGVQIEKINEDQVSPIPDNDIVPPTPSVDTSLQRPHKKKILSEFERIERYKQGLSIIEKMQLVLRMSLRTWHILNQEKMTFSKY